MICYRCKKKIADDVKFCPECGMATKLVTEAPTETIILPPDFEELTPAPAPVKPERKLELPKVELPKVELSKIKKEKPAPEMPAEKEPESEETTKKPCVLPLLIGAAAVLTVIGLAIGLRGGDVPSDIPVTPPASSAPPVEVFEPIEFTDAALWHAEKGEDFPFTHAFDAAEYSSYRLQDYSQQYMEPAEAEALMETYFTTYLEGELGFQRAGAESVSMATLPWRYVWFTHPDERVGDFPISEMNRGLDESTCDLAYAFQFGADGNLLVSCYYSADLVMREGELPPVEPLKPRIPFDDLAVWNEEEKENGRYWRIGAAEKTTDSYKQMIGTKDSTSRAVKSTLERYFDRSLTKQGFTMAGSKTYKDKAVEIGFYWFDYSGDRALEGFRYNNHAAAHTVYNCDLVYAYYVYSDKSVEIYCYYDKELVPRDSEKVLTEHVEHLGGDDSASAGQPDGPLAPEDVPAGAIPEMGAYSEGAFALVSDTATRESTVLEYKGVASQEFFAEYIDLLASKYGFRVVERDENKRLFVTQFEYTLVYEGEAAVENFEHRGSGISVIVKYWSLGSGGTLEITYARGLQAVDAGDRGMME